MPDFKAEIRKQLAGLQLLPGREAEIVEELSQHLEDEYEQALSRGATEAEAEDAVLSQLNVADRLGSELKRVERRAPNEMTLVGTQRKSNLLGDLLQDFRYGIRMM